MKEHKEQNDQSLLYSCILFLQWSATLSEFCFVYVQSQLVYTPTQWSVIVLDLIDWVCLFFCFFSVWP